MSYASRLISDSAPPARASAPVAVARLDVDVITEAGAPASAVPSEQPAAEQPRAAPDPGPRNASADVDIRGFAPTPPDPVLPIQPHVQPPVTATWTEEPRPAPTTRTIEVASVDRRTPTASTPPIRAHTPGTEAAPDVETSGLADVRPFVAEPSVAPPGDEGVAWRRLSGTDLATGRSAGGTVGVEQAIEPPGHPTPARPSDDAPAREPLPASGRHPEMESVTLSIGSIEVIVDGGNAGTIPAPVIATPLRPTARAIDDPIMRLRRQYVTWPDGD